MASLTGNQIARAALVVVLGFLASGVLGLVRTATLAATFGTSDALDAFLAAQRLPEILFVLVAGGALGSAFIPVFSRYLTGEQANPERAWQLASATMTLSAGAAFLLGLMLWALSPWLVPAVLVPGKPPEVQLLTTRLTQVMLVTPVIFSLSGLLMGILNAHQLFTLPAIAISMNNVGIIVGALVFARFGPNPPNVYGVAVGAVLGAGLHLAVQLPGLRRLSPVLRLRWRAEGLREVLTLMGPRVLGLAVVQINFVVNAAFSSGMVEGSFSALQIAWTLMFFALGVIAQGVGTALFPTLAALAAENDIDGFRARLSGAMRGVLFLALPASVVMILLGEPLIALVAQYGEWTAESTAATAWALSFFALGVAGHALLELLSRAFYALADTWTPVIVGVGAILANIALSLLFIQFMGEPGNLTRGPFAGLALANSVTTLVESGVLWWLMRRRIDGLHDAQVLRATGRTALACVGLGVAIWLVQGSLPTQAPLVVSLVGGGVGAAVFFGAAYALRLDEARALSNMVIAQLKR